MKIGRLHIFWAKDKGRYHIHKDPGKRPRKEFPDPKREEENILRGK